MTSVRGRGRGMSGGRGGGPPGQDGGNRRGSWRNGPPGSNGSFSTPRGGSPALGNISPAPRQSINDHMTVMGKVTDDKPRSASAKAFATDTDISGSAAGAQRELQPWSPDGPNASTANGGQANGTAGGGNRDAETFGFGGPPSTTPWDQFETNARLFGATTNYQEELYTTKLNRSTGDFKQREKEATRLANEIMGQTAANPHVAEERNQAAIDGPKNEEDKYSGVQRNPNAYVPPAARRTLGQSGGPPRPAPAGTPLAVPPTGPKANGSSPIPPKPLTQPPAPGTSGAGDGLTPQAPVRSTSDVVPTAENPVESDKKAAPVTKPTTDPVPAATALPSTAEPDAKQAPTVVEQFRDYIGAEREKVEAKKQSLQRQDRERTLADFKKFQTSFKVPLPMPKDILPLLAKDEEKQKAIEAKAASALEAAKRKPETPTKAPPTPGPPKKIAMKIPEIPAFRPKQPSQAGTSPVPPAIAISESSTKDIPVPTSPTPSTGSQTSQALAAKLNPKANTFVFKPNPSAVAFKPGQSSNGSPAAPPSQPSPAAGPSVPTAVNPVFFREPPQQPKVAVHDFNPWKHHDSLPAASSIHPQWPYTGRKYNASFMGPPMHPLPGAGFDEDSTSPPPGPPQLMHGVPGNFPPYGFRYQPGVPPQGMPNHMGGGSPMFSPGPGYAQLPGGGPMHSPGHMQGGPPQPNGMPMHFYQNGMPQNPQYIPPQHLHFNPNTPQRQGPPGPGGPMFFQHQVPTPQQTPQMHHHALQPPPPQQPYQSSPLQQPQSQVPTPGSFDGGH